MTDPLGPLAATRKSGAEAFVRAGAPLGFDLVSFWQWVASDLVSNTARGLVAEYVVARALGLAADGVREEWAPFDLRTLAGVTVEVKSGAYLQSWHQRKPSPIRFQIPRTLAWNAATNTQESVAVRQAQVYVFAVLVHAEKASLDPLNLDQWEFYVVPTRELDARNLGSISLASLRELTRSVAYERLAEAVATAARQSPFGEGEAIG
jgi:hypothetical protein